MRSPVFVTLLWCALNACPSEVFAGSSKTVLLLISRENGREPELMLNKEVGVMRTLLEQAGYTVKVSAPTGKELVGGAIKLKPDLKNADIQVADYDGVIVPCMAQPTGATGVEPALFETIKRIAASGKPLGAQMSSIDILRKAGVLDGKKFSVQRGGEVVQDGNIVTSLQCPYMAKYEMVEDRTTEFTTRFIEMLRIDSLK